MLVRNFACLKRWNHVGCCQIFHVFPSLAPFYTDFEKNYDPEPILNYMISLNYSLPIGLAALYLLFVYYGPKYMYDKDPYDLRWTLAAWNLLLTVFSAYCAIRFVPTSLYLGFTKSFEDSLCDPAYKSFGVGASGLAIQLFALSKLPELIDTVFIVLRKKKMIFLHWYHHLTVLLFCWNGYVNESGGGHYFASMNLIVHTIMYFYYFLQALKILPAWFPAGAITFLQISQMFIGTSLVVATLYFHIHGGKHYAPGECNNPGNHLAVGVVIYGSYLLLFLDFALRRFVFLPMRDKYSSAGKKQE
jgi:elongation of very long chain fatty acids protein 6